MRRPYRRHPVQNQIYTIMEKYTTHIATTHEAHSRSVEPSKRTERSEVNCTHECGCALYSALTVKVVSTWPRVLLLET